MKKLTTTNRDILIARIKRNYAKYKNDMSELDSGNVFEYAAEIAVYTEIYEKITGGNFYMADETIECLLRFENPLRIFVDEWWKWYDSPIIRDIDFDYFLDVITESVDENDYLTVSEAKKLCDKHKTEDVFGAILCEITELGRKYFGKGAEFCGED